MNDNELARKIVACNLDTTEEIKEKAFKMFKEGYKNIQIAAELRITCGEVRMLKLSYNRRK